MFAPDTSELYAIQRPSGEKRPSRSSKPVSVNGKDFRSPFMGSTQRSPMSPVSDWVYSKKRPSRDQSVGSWAMSFSSNGSAARERSAGLRYILKRSPTTAA